MSKRLILSDFDGTLVGYDLVVSPRVIAAVKKWVSAGNLFTVITGRSFTSVLENACQDLGLTTPIIVRGGAEMWDGANKKLLKSEFLSEKSAKVIVDVFKKHHIYFEVGKGEITYASVENHPLKDARKTYQSFTELTYDRVSKIRPMLPLGEEGDLDKIIHEEITLKLPDVHAIKAPNKFNNGYDITSEKATKYLAALEMMEQLGIPEERTIGVGDSYNDYPLLSAAGVKIAMANAPQELLDIATMVVPVVEEDGLAVAIEILLKK